MTCTWRGAGVVPIAAAWLAPASRLAIAARHGFGTTRHPPTLPPLVVFGEAEKQDEPTAIGRCRSQRSRLSPITTVISTGCNAAEMDDDASKKQTGNRVQEAGAALEALGNGYINMTLTPWEELIIRSSSTVSSSSSSIRI
ncbi:hypothetical protein EDC01DRAFT_775947 [Geopyxis carbonaria]|nr:hypothetical protein EDC01DRAFT_775947 [Geopyxis carbonaria]